MAPNLSKLLEATTKRLTPKNVLLTASLVVSAVATVRAVTWKHHGREWRLGGTDLHIHLEDKKQTKAAVDANFFRRIFRILRILVPHYFSTETGFMVLIAAALVARTACDVWMISMTTKIERTIISRSSESFWQMILQFLSALPLVSIVNQVLKYGLNELKLRFRTRLTMHLQEQYLSGFTYYKMSNLDNRIANPDQLLTQDVDRFCDCIVELYSNMTKPILDIVLYVKTLAGTVGVKTPATMIGYLALSGILLTRLRKPVGRMTMQEQKLEGEFRYVNSRIITNSEEIAFYQGNEREKKTIELTFMRLVNHLRDVVNFKAAIGIIDNIIAKYLATVVGFISVAVGFLDQGNPRFTNMSNFEIMEDYYWTGRMVIRMAEAIGMLVLAGREMTRLSGYTARVTELMDVLSDLRRNKYERTVVSRDDKHYDSSTELLKLDRASVDLNKRGDVIEKDHIIRFESVPLVTPNGDVLLREMNLEVTAGKNVLVCGPNGCGKSSLFRVLGELWPCYGGRLTKPHRRKLFYVPQRPYMTLGTFRDQVIYPDSIGEMKRKGYTDANLLQFLEKVHLGYILEREGGWDAIQDWIDVLSGGEKQRVAMARLFYHRPQFAILDECTSAVSVDVEGYMYTHCKEVGITLFTVSHRRSLWKYHEYVLYMDGRGSYEFKPIEESTTEFGS